jgi:hypothetical protein
MLKLEWRAFFYNAELPCEVFPYSQKVKFPLQTIKTEVGRWESEDLSILAFLVCSVAPKKDPQLLIAAQSCLFCPR